jgi:L-ascorbate metabolism protein UlaG (beta-lactamase superfamily)
MTRNNSINVIYIGGPTAIFEIGGIRFMTDPTLDPAGETYHSGDLIHKKIKGPANIEIGAIDFVLLSHDQHYDNLDNQGRLFVEKVAKTYTTVTAAGRLKGTMIGMPVWHSEKIKTPDGTEISITATPARHGPAGSEKLQGEVIGFLLSVKREQEVQIYITGDTVFYDGIEEVAKRYHPKYVFIFAGAAQPRGPFVVTMRTNDAIDTALAFPGATIIPLHFEGWAHLTQNENDLKQSFQVLKIDARLQILQAGITTALEM